MTGYYAEKLSGERLRRCYEVASPRVRQYLEAEIRHVLARLRETDSVLELGCGYGRVAFRLADRAARVTGIDTAEESVTLARRLAPPSGQCEFLVMDAYRTAFDEGSFDAVVCVQNGISAFGGEPGALLREALRVARRGGKLLLSTYADAFWDDRLAWFEAQAAEGLVGPIDRAASRDGFIVCTDGFRSGRITPLGLRALCERAGVDGDVTEVDGSSVFLETSKP
jgi:2-polyprenyl-6-hydroxyphenyl methylase/3-demethylubiquinone-9 3-methyltransferase